MSRSKSRPGSMERDGKKHHHSSVFLRTISATKLCRGDGLGSQIASNALTPVDKKTPSKVSGLSENRANRAEKDQPRAAKEVYEPSTRNEPLYPSKAVEIMMELEYLKSLLHSSTDELKIRDQKIESLESELAKTRDFEEENNASLNKLEEELRSMTEKEKDMVAFLVDNERRIWELEAALESEKEAMSKMACLYTNQSKELEVTVNEAEKSKFEMTFLRNKIESLAEASKKCSLEDKVCCCNPIDGSMGEETKSLEFEIQVMRENLTKAEEGKRKALLEADRLFDEMELLGETEKKNAKVAEDLALALKLAVKEANQARRRYESKEIELGIVEDEVKKLKKLLEEAKQEADLHKNTANRVRLEAEETFLAWNAKETGFISCVKRAEDERTFMLNENERLRELLLEAESMISEAREETFKLREVLKQAVDEANVAKAAARMARDENFQLHDRHEASAESKNDDEDEEQEKRNMNKTFNFNLEDLKLIDGHEDADENVSGCDPVKTESLKSLISSTYVTFSPAFGDGGTRPNTQDIDQFEGEDDDSDTDQSSQIRMSTMFRRVGDLLMIRRSVPSGE